MRAYALCAGPPGQRWHRHLLCSTRRDDERPTNHWRNALRPKSPVPLNLGENHRPSLSASSCSSRHVPSHSPLAHHIPFGRFWLFWAVKTVLGSSTELDQTKCLLKSKLIRLIRVKAQSHHLATTLDLSSSQMFGSKICWIHRPQNFVDAHSS